MSSFEKLCCAFDENFVRCAHYRVCNANSPAAVELFLQTRSSGYCSLANGRCIKNTDINFYER